MNRLKESRAQESRTQELRTQDLRAQDTIMLMLGRLEGKVDSLLVAKVAMDEKIGEIERRLQGLEHRLAYWAGSIGVASCLVVGAVEWLHGWLHRS